MSLPISREKLEGRLIQEGLIQQGQFQQLVREAERKNQNIIDVLISEGIASPEYINRFIAGSLGVELANLGQRGINEAALRLLPEGVARERSAIVFDQAQNGTLSVAMRDPSDLATIEYLSKRLKANIKPFLATADDLNRAFSIYGSARTSDFKQIIEENIRASLQATDQTAEEAAAQIPLVSLVDNILSYAASLRTSDIHIEALEDQTLIRYRIDGILHEILRIPKAVHAALAARIKLLSGLQIDEHNKPQDGRFRHKLTNKIIDVRVSVMPTSFGEKIVMRLLESTQKPLSLTELGMDEDTASMVKENLEKAYGMILSCGPTGSGKTTTLYALTNIVNDPDVNIVTIEDPIEYNIRYVNQSQVNPRAGVTFASGLRSLVRQDPDIVMVGEIRDDETANIAVQAAMTGHLLFSSLHTNDAPTAIPRLIDLNVPAFLVASTLNVVIAQRLVRKVCPTCIVSYAPEDNLGETIDEQLRDLDIETGDYQVPNVLYRGEGCEACGGIGYRGRIGIFEVLDVDEGVRKAISSSDFTLGMLRGLLRGKGMRTMFQDGLQKVEVGVTTIEEVLRVIRE